MKNTVVIAFKTTDGSLIIAWLTQIHLVQGPQLWSVRLDGRSYDVTVETWSRIKTLIVVYSDTREL